MADRVVVTGGRSFDDPLAVVQALRARSIEALAHGGASGADRFAAQAAEYLGIPVTEYAADWSQGRKAGPMRNRRMLDDFKPTLVLAFPGGRGTADCVRAARERGIRVVEVSPDA